MSKTVKREKTGFLCAECGGTGLVAYKIANHGDRDEFVRDKCRVCDGTGEEYRDRAR